LFFHLVDNHLVDKFFICKVTHFQRTTQILKKNIEAVYAEDAAVADTAALAGSQQFHIEPAYVKIVP